MNTPRINPNDPKWTAYVLGELGEAETAAVDRLLAASPEARALIDELKVASVAMEEALASEPQLHLTPAQRSAIRREAAAHAPRGFAALPLRWAWGVGGTAMAAAILVVVQFSRQPQQRVIPEAVTAQAPATRTPVAGASRQPQAASRTPASSSTPEPPAASRRSTPVSPSLADAAMPRAEDRAAAAAAPVVTVDAAPRPDAGATGTATLTGEVRDASGAVLPGVTVTATNPISGVVSSTVTDSAGRYTFGNLDVGVTYRLTAALAGFQPESSDLQLADGGTVARALTMRVGGLAETITVKGETPVVDVQNLARQARSAAPTLRSFAGAASDAVEARPSVPPARSRGTESYASLGENTFVRASQEPLATFSIDVDTASYSNVRRFLNQNQLPPADAVRVEELINYFTYEYPRPSGPHPIGASLAVAAAPWNARHRLVRIGVRARDIDASRRPPSNLVFLIDVSGSMNTPEKLPLVKSGLKLLVDQLGENDRISIVVYASATGLVLRPTRGDQKDVIARALDNLEAGGSTNGGAGIQLAYEQASANFIRGGTNRVILVTDGDFNVGITGQDELTRLIESRAKSGVFLSVLGFGMGNLKDSTLERLADQGNGHYAYIDSLSEARKVLVEQMSGTLVTVAKDVKIQVDFNPSKVEAYRLLGYENRLLRPEDFNNDLKDAGDMGAGHTVTALFEIVPRGGSVPGSSIDPSVFQPTTRTAPPPASNSNDLLVLRVRYKLPDTAASTRMDVPLADRGAAFSATDADFRFAASVAAFGMILTGSPNRGDATLAWVLDVATASRGADRGGYRSEFIGLVQKAMALQGRR